MNVYNFILEIIKYDRIEDILENYKNQSEKGYVYERLWDIIIKFGFQTLFPKSKFNHLIGNTYNAKLKFIKKFK